MSWIVVRKGEIVTGELEIVLRMKVRWFALSSGVLEWACSLGYADGVYKFVRWASEEVGVYIMNCREFSWVTVGGDS